MVAIWHARRDCPVKQPAESTISDTVLQQYMLLIEIFQRIGEPFQISFSFVEIVQAFGIRLWRRGPAPAGSFGDDILEKAF